VIALLLALLLALSPTPPISGKATANPVLGTANLAVTGIASFVGPRYGSRYLALPGGPGISVRICSLKACVLRVSTDAGPDKAMQRAGRIADLSWRDFKTLCRCDPATLGLIRVSVSYGGPTIALPPTDAGGA
jgi:hypothetical protein